MMEDSHYHWHDDSDATTPSRLPELWIIWWYVGVL